LLVLNTCILKILKVEICDKTPMIEPVYSPKKTWNWVDIVLIVAAVGFVLATGLILLNWTSHFKSSDFSQGETPSALTSLWLVGLEIVALVSGVYFFGVRRKGRSWGDLGLQPATMRWMLVSAGISLIGIPLSGLIALIIVFAFNLPMESPQLGFLLPEGLTWLSGLGILIFGGFAAPFAEELFFRGVFYTWLRERWSLWPSALLSALVFGIAHGDILVGGVAFVLGIVLALVFEYSHSLWTAILVHIVNNSVRIILLYVLFAFGLFPG